MVRRLLILGSLLTLLPPAPAVGLSDQPGTCAGATTNSSVNVWLSETVGSTTDQDWYRFTVSSQTYVLITLGDLPANYQLELYGACGTKLAGSNRSGRTYEEIYRNLAVGTYRVRVSGVSGANSSSPYALRIRPLAQAVSVLSYSVFTDSYGYLNIPGEVLNNTTTNREFVKISATFYNASNQVLDTDFTYTLPDIVKARTRGAFLLWAPKPAGFDHLKLVVSTWTTTDAPVPGLAISPGVRNVDAYDWLHYPGEVTNSAGSAAEFVQVVLTMYGARGQVRNVEWTYTDPSTIGPGETSSFEVIVFDHHAGTNRYVLSADAM